MHLAMVAAGFSAGQADRLRRAMAAWKRRGGLGPFEAELTAGMRERGYSDAFAQRIFSQIKGFGEYGFPESHAASFALLVYVSAWLKRHEPAAFYCALLNSLPMGFYAPAQLVQAARRAGVEVRDVDVLHSQSDASLERGADGEPALRIGLRQIKGLTELAAARILAQRDKADSITALAQAAQLERRDLETLAGAGALRSLTGHRHRARWEVTGVEAATPLLGRARFNEATPLLTAPQEGDNVVADYRYLGMTLERHPLALLRPQLVALRMRTAIELAALPDGSPMRTAGLVITRQRPGTASGVTFITLEDETGSSNLVVWRKIADRQRKVLLGARLMGVEGHVQREGDVVHLVVRRMLDMNHLLGKLEARSRDFH